MFTQTTNRDSYYRGKGRGRRSLMHMCMADEQRRLNRNTGRRLRRGLDQMPQQNTPGFSCIVTSFNSAYAIYQSMQYNRTHSAPIPASVPVHEFSSCRRRSTARRLATYRRRANQLDQLACQPTPRRGLHDPLSDYGVRGRFTSHVNVTCVETAPHGRGTINWLLNCQRRSRLQAYPTTMLLQILPLLISAATFLTSRAALSVPGDAYWANLARQELRRLCVVRPDADGGDDAPAIQRALNRDCRSKSLVVFPGPQYKIATIMNTTQLEDVVIHQYGRILWTPDVDYWLTVSEYVGYQNQSTVWFFGGDRVIWDGHGVGTLDGNGQVWYNWARGRSNLPRRPMNINFRGFNNSVVRGMNFVQSQMWTMALMWSRNVVMEDIYVNNTSTRQGEVNPLNTDGFDSLYADNVTLSRWRVVSGDDAIALKANSTNIFVYDSEIWGGSGFAIGSVGQYPGNYEVVENFFVRNVTMHRSNFLAYFKSWTGNPHGYPPNGGGGGFGYGRNSVFEDITLDHIRSQPFYTIQCINFEGHEGEDCDSSEFHFDDIVWRRVRGTVNSGVTRAGYFNCSGKAGGCNNITITDIDIHPDGKDEALKKFECHNVNGTIGFECTDFF